MDQATLSSESVLDMLLKTNRPPTNQETAIIRESMAPTNAKLQIVEAQISDTKAHIQALKAQVEQAETKLQRLREEETAILETFADHRRVFSPFRNLPEDVLREICIACVDGDMPLLSYRKNAVPYVLAQISSRMRHVALTMPTIWSTMHVEIRPYLFSTFGEHERAYALLARRASKWIGRAGALALTVFIEDSSHGMFEGCESNPSSILVDTVFSYSARWKELQFQSRCKAACPATTRIAALTAVDAPLLQSVSLRLDCIVSDSGFRDSALLTIPTLRNVKFKLETYSLTALIVNWATLTSITLRGIWLCYQFHSTNVVARILQQTKCLVFCDIVVARSNQSEEHYPNKINLAFLKTLIMSENTQERAPSQGAPTILDVITAPVLEKFDIRGEFLEHSLSNFLRLSPRIWKLSLPYLDTNNSLKNTVGFLRHCPSLTVLSLWPVKWHMGTRSANRFLRAFVKEGDVGVICPRLQYFDFRGNIDFSLQTLHLFLEGKQGKITIPNVLPWKKVVINISLGIKTTETFQQMLDLASQKKAAGLNVEITESQYRQ